MLSLSLNAQVINRMQIIMSTFVSISAQEKDKDDIEQGFIIFKDVELSLSSFLPKATIYKLNKNKEVRLDFYSYEAFSLSKKYYEKTDGYFDITIGSITKDLYSFGQNEKEISKDELKRAKVSFMDLVFDKNKAYIKKDMKVDLGGMGKGYAVDKVAEYFRSKEISSTIIRASGDIRCLDICEVGIQDPFSDGILLSFKTGKKDLAISTSGIYNRYIKNTKNNHLINPKLKKSQINFVSITLVGDMKNADLDAYATAASVMPIKKAYQFLNSIGVAYIVIESDNTMKVSGKLSLIMGNAIKKQPGYIYTK